MNASEVMTRAVIGIDPEAPILQAIRLMTGHKISGLPVVEQDGRIAGMLTEGDLLRRAETGTEGDPPGWLKSFLMLGHEASRYVRTHARRVGEVMTSDVVTIREDTPLSDVVELMLRHRVKRLPVVRDGRLVGVVSRADLVRKVGQAMSAPTGSTDDGTIQRAILDTMEEHSWSRGNGVAVAVEDGVAGLDGCLFDFKERSAMTVLAENVPGVKRVENRIICIEPMSGMVTYDPAAG